jgi:hypothetical protein
MKHETKELRIIPLLDEPYQNVIHPRCNFSVGEAIALAINNAMWLNRRKPTTLQEVRDYICEMFDRVGCNWLTGLAALDVLDAVIDGKVINQSCRYP